MILQKSWVARGAVANLLLGLALGGCSDSSRKLTLLENEQDGGARDRAAEEARLREMQLVSVVYGDGSVDKIDAGELRNIAAQGCAYEATERLFGVQGDDTCFRSVYTDCRPAVCDAQVSLCTANQLLDASAIRAEPVQIGSVSVFAQTNAVNVALARLAMESASSVMKEGAEALYDASINGEVWS